MSTPWLDRVHAYCDTLESTLFTFRGRLQSIRGAIVSGESKELRERSLDLVTSIEGLRDLVAQREQLLEAAPTRASRLTEALKQIAAPRAASLAVRCKRIAQDMQAVHRETIAIFVAEYHLIQTTEDLLALLTSGSLAYSTYSHPQENRNVGYAHGRILDKAA